MMYFTFSKSFGSDNQAPTGCRCLSVSNEFDALSVKTNIVIFFFYSLLHKTDFIWTLLGLLTKTSVNKSVCDRDRTELVLTHAQIYRTTWMAHKKLRNKDLGKGFWRSNGSGIGLDWALKVRRDFGKEKSEIFTDPSWWRLDLKLWFLLILHFHLVLRKS